MNLLELATRSGDKVGSVGAVVSTMGCAMCFPAAASSARILHELHVFSLAY